MRINGRRRLRGRGGAGGGGGLEEGVWDADFRREVLDVELCDEEGFCLGVAFEEIALRAVQQCGAGRR